ncbi:DUF397 domain-containing protein [Streptomyces avicenniae]|uniref:DUF397 domain-containing protein n=1 Tax=Streptomyces avicenniae TaxID=500153 RepID=UPI001CBA642C|nr:DUF397 domain-containing protein [Streptomyces avicenniae]
MATISAQPEWRTSSFTASNGNCVEVALAAVPEISVRDTKDRLGGTTHVSPAAWSAFIMAASTGFFDSSDGN